MEETNHSQQPTAEQLLKLLDTQLASMRQKREVESPSSRNALRVFSLCVIVFGAALALWVLMYMLDEMRPPKPEATAAPAQVEGTR
jgi:hypothetical protein